MPRTERWGGTRNPGVERNSGKPYPECAFTPEASDFCRSAQNDSENRSAGALDTRGDPGGRAPEQDYRGRAARLPGPWAAVSTLARGLFAAPGRGWYPDATHQQRARQSLPEQDHEPPRRNRSQERRKWSSVARTVESEVDARRGGRTKPEAYRAYAAEVSGASSTPQPPGGGRSSRNGVFGDPACDVHPARQRERSIRQMVLRGGGRARGQAAAVVLSSAAVPLAASALVPLAGDQLSGSSSERRDAGQPFESRSSTSRM